MLASDLLTSIAPSKAAQVAVTAADRQSTHANSRLFEDSDRSLFKRLHDCIEVRRQQGNLLFRTTNDCTPEQN